MQLPGALAASASVTIARWIASGSIGQRSTTVARSGSTGPLSVPTAAPDAAPLKTAFVRCCPVSGCGIAGVDSKSGAGLPVVGSSPMPSASKALCDKMLREAFFVHPLRNFRGGRLPVQRWCNDGKRTGPRPLGGVEPGGRRPGETQVGWDTLRNPVTDTNHAGHNQTAAATGAGPTLRAGYMAATGFC